ncbi:MAG: phosphatidylserine decarboxylase [Candidatus Aminicenantes bacterium]|nr:phosphatidylserine decarboxylase [Candidatus Aminicenantes bacterium]
MKNLLVVMFCMFVLVLGLNAGEKKVDKTKHPVIVKKSCPTGKHTPIVEKLITILEVRPGLKNALLHSLKVANRLDAPTLEEYYKYLDYIVTTPPTDRNVYYNIVEFYYLIDHPLTGKLQTDKLFQQWTVEFANAWGSYLDTPASAAGICTFLADPEFSMGDYQPNPSGWLTFNQFFAREVRPGKRPIACLYDDRVIVSPADCAFVGCWEIEKDSKIFVKGKNDKPYSIVELLDESPYKDKFIDGRFYHSFLDVNDYHRYHVPVAGIVKEARQITGKVYLASVQCKDGSIHALDDTGYQFQQSRGLIVIDSTAHVGGYVAVLPIGMAQVSSCNITAEVGSWLHKGEEFGYFLFGGSDIIILFDKDCKVNICMKPNTHYKQGAAVAYAGVPCPDGRPSCPTKEDLTCPPILGPADCIPCIYDAKSKDMANFDPCKKK